jgi:hypothetical protein
MIGSYFNTMSDLPPKEPLYGALSFVRPEIWVNRRISRHGEDPLLRDERLPALAP